MSKVGPLGAWSHNLKKMENFDSTKRELRDSLCRKAGKKGTGSLYGRRGEDVSGSKKKPKGAYPRAKNLELKEPGLKKEKHKGE